MVGKEEISDIMEYTGLSFGEIAEPYPDRILEGDLDYTFGWVLRRTGDRCRFLDESSCQIYPVRPWICRTYPFMLDENDLTIHPCEGTGQNTGSADAENIAHDLCRRYAYEQEQDERSGDSPVRNHSGRKAGCNRCRRNKGLSWVKSG